MNLFNQEKPLNPSNSCKFLASLLKDAFSKCHSFPGNLCVSSPDEEEPAINFDEEDEVFVSAIISKYTESKCKRKSAMAIETFKWDLSPEPGHFVINPKAMQIQGSYGENREEFLSADSRLSRCSSATNFNAFVSVKTRFFRSSSLNKIDFQSFHCEGWPFGLCRKALLLPPLPKSPPDSWSWTKSPGMAAKIHG